MRHHIAFFVVPMVFGIGCGDGPADATRTPTPSAAGLELACGLRAAPKSISVGEGARHAIALDDLANDAAVEATSEADAVTVVSTEGKRLVVRAPYGGTKRVVLKVRATCAAGASAISIDVDVNAMKWSRLAEWTWKAGNEIEPPGREYGQSWIDPNDPDRLIVFGGFHYHPKQFTPANDLWEFSFSRATWRKLPAEGAPMRPGARVAGIPETGDILFFGGLQGTDTPAETYRVGMDRDGARFEPVTTSGEIVGSYTGSLMYDAPRKRFVSACGASDQSGPNCTAFAFAFDGERAGRWEEIAVAKGPHPQGRMGFHYAYDPEAERIVIFGGDGATSRAGADIYEDTWALELAETPARWVQLLGAQEPRIGRRNGAWIYDPNGHRLIVWGGTPDGRSTMPGLDILHLDRGKEAWFHVETPPEVRIRSSATAVFDAKNHRMVAGFGNSSAGTMTDLWALEL